MVDAIALTNRANAARKADAFLAYRKARKVLAYNKAGQPNGMGALFVASAEKKVFDLETEYPDFKNAYERVER